MYKKVTDHNWVKDETPLSEKAIAEMRHIVDGILSGELRHNQKRWHTVVRDEQTGEICGTAHCVAGWCELLGKRADKQRKSLFKVSKHIVIKQIKYYLGSLYQMHERLFNGFEDNRSALDYAKDRWGLNSVEADAFFDGKNTKQQLKAYVDRFEKGMRIHVYKASIYRSSYAPSYYSPYRYGGYGRW